MKNEPPEAYLEEKICEKNNRKLKSKTVKIFIFTESFALNLHSANLAKASPVSFISFI